ncbi:MAG: Holliday junction branch migration protein RuvA [bacterium]|nr:Holliday junction branch migration protein RuvA [bacterium]
MIGKLTGHFDGTTPDGLVRVEVGGVGYVVRVSLVTLAELNPSTTLRTNSDISLFVHTAVREDTIDLYGFPSEDGLAFFKQLMSVSGIGPKTALGVMSVADLATLKGTIARGDATTLTRVFGIGKKNAERLVVELRDKLANAVQSPSTALGATSDVEVLEALMALGYRADEARAALKDATGASTRERLAAALKQLGTRKKI